MTNPSLALSRQLEAQERAQEHWRSRSAHKEAAWTIALAREAGTPGTTVAQELGRRLGWTVYDNELLERVATEMGLRADLLASVDERRKSWLLESVEGFASTSALTETSFVRHLIQSILSLGVLGHAVIVGRGAVHILPAETTLRVRLVGLLDDRVAATSKRLKISTEEAARWVENTDRERARFIRDHFLKDTSDPRHYDLVLNTSRWSVADCADLIIQALNILTKRAAQA